MEESMKGFLMGFSSIGRSAEGSSMCGMFPPREPDQDRAPKVPKRGTLQYFRTLEGKQGLNINYIICM